MGLMLMPSSKKSSPLAISDEHNFLISDAPLGYDGGSENLYQYVKNNPINETDPLGLAPPNNFQPPSNTPQPPPSPDKIPPGWRIRTDPPDVNYPNGHWHLEKPLPGGKWQPINPSTGKPGPAPDTHIPLPPKPTPTPTPPPSVWPWWLPRIPLPIPILVIPRCMLPGQESDRNNPDNTA